MPIDLLPLTADLRALGGGRVWSLMISLFGDLAQGEGDVIAGPVLSQIMAGLGVKPEAARVALHRLRNDGWITTNKVGRISHHSLTAKGRVESAAASPRIYAQPDAGPQDWQMVLLPDTKTPLPAGFIALQPRLCVGPAGATIPDNALPLQGGPAPDWLKQELSPDGLAQDYEKLHTALKALAGTLPPPDHLSASDTALLRCLIVHNWRRLVLKHPALPTALINTSSHAHQSHILVADLLNRLQRPTLDAIAREYAAA